ncbi:MerR family transcriptional regulator [Bacillus sp. PS06]|uniref:MerR family transcriptional regulator n=1 Tax=Bacillus sp. PS06 TaxID=2764176 RepID=UPI0017813BAF|nr:MerR family transcriptional regulator [Bacillus sp. PS06]MBD8071354.1 MerR family transcriptional regulator [Bacillus sp. PS06]
MNTAALASKVGVSSKTIRRWIKYFDIPCKKNEHGHFVFDETDYSFFCQIRDQVKQGIPKSEIDIMPPRKGKRRQAMATQTEQSLQQQFSKLLERVEQNEKAIEQKASEVVSYQLLQHRREIDELLKRVETLETYVHELENENKQLKLQPNDGPIVLDQPIQKPRKARKLKTMMSFLF